MPAESRRDPAPATPPEAPVEALAATVRALNGAARKRTTPSGDGVMVWRVWGAGEPVVLLHGGYGSWTHWIRIIPELSQHYELWVPDMPGLGSSAMPPDPRTPPGIAQVVAAGLGEIFPPGAGVRLVGFSFGGTSAPWRRRKWATACTPSLWSGWRRWGSRPSRASPSPRSGPA